jgi:hypothetical protein
MDAVYGLLALAGWWLVIGFAAGCARLEGTKS